MDQTSFINDSVPGLIQACRDRKVHQLLDSFLLAFFKRFPCDEETPLAIKETYLREKVFLICYQLSTDSNRIRLLSTGSSLLHTAPLY